MSVRIMSQVFENTTLGPTERLIMLALADHADDAGKCYPSMKRLRQRTGLGERAIQNNLKKLTRAGYVTIKAGGGRGHANLYLVTANPAHDAPFTEEETPHLVPENPASRSINPASRALNPAPDAGEPSRTIIEPSVTPPVAPPDAKPVKARLPEGWVPDDDDRAYALSQNLTDDEIQEIADDFHAYWRDRTDAGGKKSERGWHQTWKNRVRDVAPRFIRNRRMAFSAQPGGRGQGGGIAGVVARRQFGG